MTSLPQPGTFFVGECRCGSLNSMSECALHADRCVASCTSYLEELTNEADLVGNVGTHDSHFYRQPYLDLPVTLYWWMIQGSSWMQFRFTVGAPSAEAQFASEREQACAQDANARQYPSLYVSVTGHSISRDLCSQCLTH